MKIKQRIARFFLRDLFACQAMASQMSKPLTTEDLQRLAAKYPGIPIGQVFAYKAYEMADYMLALRG